MSMSRMVSPMASEVCVSIVGTPPVASTSSLSASKDPTAMLIKEYYSLEQQALALETFECKDLDLDVELAKVSDQISAQKERLAKTEKHDAQLRKRIWRNENPRFFHYLVWNREAKVQHLRAELHELQTTECGLSSKLTADSARLASLQHQQQNGHLIADKKQQLEGQCRQLFDKVVDAQPPTRTLQQLHAAELQQRSLLTSEQRLVDDVQDIMEQVSEGLSLFEEAESLYREAQSARDPSKSMKTATMKTDDLKSVSMRYASEVSQQGHKNDLAKEACALATKAIQMTTTAFRNVSRIAIRYPQLGAAIGRVAFPRIQAPNAEASHSDALFDMHGAFFGSDHQAVDECARITSQQLGLIKSMQAAMIQNVQGLQLAIKTLEQDIVNERNTIFNNVRTAVMAASQPAPAA